MADIKLYLDEDISPVIGVVLRSRGYDVVSTHEVDMNGREDKEQLDYAIKNKRALLTFNARHFAPLAEKYYKEGKEHFGIIVSKKVSLSEMIRLIVNMMKSSTAEDFKNSFIWLQSFKPDENDLTVGPAGEK